MQSKAKRRFLIVTNLDLWSMSMGSHGATMGNQSLYNCVLGWARHGYEVHILTPATRITQPIDLPENVRLHRHPLPGRRLKGRLRDLKNKFLRRRGAGARTDVRKPTTELDWRTFINRPLVAMFYVWIGLWTLLLHLRYRFTFFYGYECLGVQVAWFWSRVFRRKLVTRFQGTLMTQWIDRPDVLKKLAWLAVPLRLKSDLVIMTNDGTQGDRMLAHYGVPPERYVFWRNGVAFQDELDPGFDPQALRRDHGISPEMVLFTSASRMVGWKRIDRILRAAAKMNRRPDFKVILIGDGHERPALEALAEELGLGDRVHFAGAIAHKSVIQWHLAADVLISTFDISNVGNQLLEAQRLGKPYISVNTGDTADILIDGRNGLLVDDPEDIDSLAAAMSQMIRDGDLRRRLAEGALAVGKEKVPTWRERMDREVALVEERLGLRRP